MPFGYEIFAGNRHASTTVEDIVETMERRYGKADRIWVMDRGMVSQNNIELLKQDGRSDPVTIAKRIGRLLGQNSRAAGLFETNVKKRCDGGAKLVWKKIESWRDWAALSEGCYMLRTNINDWNDEEL